MQIRLHSSGINRQPSGFIYYSPIVANWSTADVQRLGGMKGSAGLCGFISQNQFKKMKLYDNETLLLIPGKSPVEKHENLIEILRIVQEIGFPRRGTPEETKTLQDFADEIIKLNLVEQ